MKTKFDDVRNQFMGAIRAMFEASNYEVLQTGTQEICIPVVNDEKDEGYIVLTFKIPKGSRDGDAYDGYAMAEEYEMKCAERREKAKERAEAKAKKIERDKKMREQRAEAKAKRTAE